MSAVPRNSTTMVNELFTMARYAVGMIDRFQVAARLLVCAFAILFSAGVIANGEARAQSAEIDWEDTGVASQGSLPSGTTATGSDGTVATITYSSQTNGGGTFVPAFSPTFVSYFNGTIGGAASPLLVSFDNQQYDPLDRITITITLDRAVENLNFSLGDIDFGSFADAVQVSYDNNATGGFTNAATNTAFWTIGSSVARTNDATVNGWRGIAGSATAATDGNINFDFGSQAVQRIRIIYYSYTGTGDPTAQFMGISDFEFDGLGADLSLSKTLIGSPPIQGGSATWRLTVINAAASAASTNNVIVRDTFPAGFSFGSSSGDGTFNSANGQWSVGTLDPGDSATITITGTISSAAGTTITNVAEIISSSEIDPDSTVNNGVTTEDDYASSSFTVQSGRAPGVPPVLSCPAGQSVFDWDNVTDWTAGSTDRTYPFETFGDTRFQISNDGAFLNSADFGGQTPTVTNFYTGNLTPAQTSLHLLSDQANRTGVATAIVTLPRSFTGLQFTIFDVDFGTNQFADRVVVTGSNGGSNVNPTLTNGNVNFVSGNTVIGDGASGNTQALGNVVVTFTQPVDRITIQYGNHTTAPTNPGQQGISLHDITVCDPFTTLSVTKVSTIIFDPINGGPPNAKAIPGATVEYLITVTNTGGDYADDGIAVWDDGPADAKMCLLGRSGGPVIFNDPGSNSDLIYDYGGAGSIPADLIVDTDDLEFSDDNGATFDYEPVVDGDGCDANITDFRVMPGGEFASGGNFTLTVRYIIK